MKPTLLLLATTLSAVPAMAFARSTNEAPPAQVAVSGAAGDVQKAAELERQARVLMENRDTWKDAANLLVRAADLRPVEDPERFANLLLAGRTLYYAGEKGRARNLIEQAADNAVVLGSVVDAALAYIQAAHIAVEQRRQTEARALARKADLLSNSPLLSTAQRNEIRSRLGSV